MSSPFNITPKKNPLMFFDVYVSFFITTFFIIRKQFVSTLKQISNFNVTAITLFLIARVCQF